MAVKGQDKETAAQAKVRLLKLTWAFCDARLNQECGRLTAKLVNVLAKEKPAPFLSGKIESWAAGVLQAFCSLNFLFDKKGRPRTSPSDITAFFGVSQQTAYAKAKAVREALVPQYTGEEFLIKRRVREREALQEMSRFIEELSGGGPDGSPALRRAPNGGFVDRDRPARTAYYEGMEAASVSPERARAFLEGLIRQDPYFLDPYLTLRAYDLEQGRLKEAAHLLDDAFRRATALLCDARGELPPGLEWGWPENRHLIRTIEAKAIDLWEDGVTSHALALFRYLLRSDPGDNVGVRYNILAIRMGLAYQDLGPIFATETETGYWDLMKMEDWFTENNARFPEEFDAWKQQVGWEA